jgi:hypothetical protein
MRRALSISLILLLWLPALAALVPGIDDERLPFCCRRQGAHHCAMDSAAGASDQGAGPALAAPSRCPEFPAAVPATVSQPFVAAGQQAHWTDLVASFYALKARREAAHSGKLSIQFDRGPPAFLLA